MGQKKGNPIPSYQNQGYENLYPSDHYKRDMGTKPVMIDDDRNLNELIDSGSWLLTSGYAKDTDLTSGLIRTKFSSVTFDTASIPSTLPDYTLAVNLQDRTLDLRMGNNATNQLGQELYYPPIVNKSGEDLLDGDLVMVNPAGVAQGNRISVVKCVSDGTYPADLIVGVLTEDVARNAEGFATWFGYVRNISKTHLQPAGETWVEGDILYPNPTIPGKMTNVLPTAPALKSTIAAVTSINGNNVTLLVRPALRGKLDTLHNVDTTSATTGSILYNSGSVWTSTNNIKASNSTLILAQVSASLNFVNDTAAAAGGVPLGGLYRNGNVIQIRLV